MKRFQIKVISLFLLDLVIILISYIISALLIANFTLRTNQIFDNFDNLYWIVPVYAVTFVFFKLYKSLWRYASIEEAINVFLGVLVSAFVIAFIEYFAPIDLQLNDLIIANILLFLGLMSVRFSYRVIRIVSISRNSKLTITRTLVIGAGNAGILILKDIRINTKINNKVVCFLDDDKGKVGKFVHGVKVVGTSNDIPYIAVKYRIDEVIIAMPSATRSQIQAILKKCDNIKSKIKILPPFYELLDKKLDYKKVRDVQIEDLLGRDEIKIDDAGISDFLKDEVILVTGGGGSIGSELCRQVVKYSPKTLIIFDIYENNAYDIQNELIRHFQHKNITNIDLKVIIGSVRDQVRLYEVFEEFKPTIVFHAAAHKHVPLMEASPKEAIKNNVFGTYNVAKIADIYKVKKFVLISTDKAVNPTNIMGATKRFAEMIIQGFNKISSTQYAAVRFGNVLGSNGSVIPLFKKQIQEGGPVTVTHKDIIRYFMTIPEAVQLVLQAGAFAQGGEIFVLDMGQPVKILDLAEKLIRFSGYEPYSEIDIQVTGLRPGEKLYEELLMAEEGLLKTFHEKIFVSQVNGITMDDIKRKLEDLELIIDNQSIDIKKEMKRFVPTYLSENENVSTIIG